VSGALRTSENARIEWPDVCQGAGRNIEKIAATVTISLRVERRFEYPRAGATNGESRRTALHAVAHGTFHRARAARLDLATDKLHFKPTGGVILQFAIIALALFISFTCGGGIGWAHDRLSAFAPSTAEAEDTTDISVLSVLTGQLQDSRIAMAERLRIAKRRRDRLAALIAKNPRAVLKHAMKPSARAALAPDLQALVEAEESHEGTLQVLHADHAGGGAYLYNLRKTTGEWLALHFAQDAPVVETGTFVRVRGVRVDQALALGDSGVTVLASAGSGIAFGEHKTLAILVKFSNAPTVASATAAQAQTVLFGAGGVSDFYRETSYQQTWLTGGVVGPLLIATTTVGCNYNLIASLAQTAASAAGVALGQYQNFVYLFTGSDCPWWGLGTVGGSPGQAWINGPVQNLVVAHELGHTFGLYHSHALECGTVTFGGSCSSIEYGDYFDTMGSTTASHFNAVQKDLLGWLDYGVSPPITQVTASGTYTIDPLETPGTNPKAIKVQSALGDWFYVEYRRPIGFDTGAVAGNPNVANGVLVHYWSGAGNGVYLLDMTPATSSWTDPALDVGATFSDPDGGVTITPVWVDGTTAGVNVTIAAICTRANPAVTMTPAQQQGTAGTPLTYTVSVTSRDANCGTTTFSLQAATPTGWSAALGATSLALADGATTSTTLTVTPPATAAAATYSLTATATGPTLAMSASASYVVTAPPPPAGATGLFTDSFNRADASTLGNGWSVVAGSLKITANEARNDVTRTMHMAVQPALVGPTQTASMKFASMDNNLGPLFGVVMRYRDPANYYRCYRSAGASSTVRVSRVVGGVEKVLYWRNITNPVKGTFFTLACQVSGTTITLQINGATWISINDTTFATGSVGFMMGYVSAAGAGVSHRADDFSASAK